MINQSSVMAVGESGLIIEDNGNQNRAFPAEEMLYIGDEPVNPCVFPANKLYSFYWPGIGNFGIPESREISFTKPDKFNFVFAGYLSKQNNKPLYYITRESDGKCLSFTLGGPAYTENHAGNYQKWLVSHIENNTYNFVLPAVPGCFVIRPCAQGGKHFLSVKRSRDVKNFSSVMMYMTTI